MPKEKIIHYAKYDGNTGENMCGVDSPNNVIRYTSNKVTCKRCLAAMGSCENCCRGEAKEPHACPYKEELNDDSETLCTCCDDCIYECSQDI